ncbi:MAG: SigB/SigF/SigG family RNA polymerase sigma factor [Actinobacteria bacterium]|nr:MAG: SigB/SigF/SigG family RNA polymerase sigma factor [Actinomycetota bacterium]
MASVDVTIESRSRKRGSGTMSAGPSLYSRKSRARKPLRATNGAVFRNVAVSRHSEASRRASARVGSRALLYEYHRRGDLRARERLISQYLPLVRRLARQYAARGEQVEDLVQVGSIGLINSIDRFELDRGVDLSAYAIPSIVGEIKRYLRDLAWPIRIPRRLQELRVSVRASAAELAAELERPATIAEIAREAHVGPDDVVEALASERSHQLVSLSGANGNGDGALDRNGSIEGGYEACEDRATLARGFRVLDEREQRLLHLAFFRGMSQSQIAGEVGISQIHVSRLTRRALEKLRDEIGPTSG